MALTPKLEVPCRGTITELSGESGTLQTAAGPVRFGVTACSGFTPTVGLEVWLIDFRQLPIVGPRATLINLTGASESASIEDVKRDRERARAAENADVRIDDAAAWLASHPDQYGADCFVEPGSALTMVTELLAAGTVQIALVAYARDRSTPNRMEIELPSDPERRRSVFAILAREWERHNEDFSASPDGRAEPEEITREEALAMGHPEAEGELRHDVGAPLDAGQSIMTLWWD